MLQRTMSLAAMAAAAALWSSGAIAQDQKVYGVLLTTLSKPFCDAMEQGVLNGKEVETFQDVTTQVLSQDVLEEGSEPLLEFVK